MPLKPVENFALFVENFCEIGGKLVESVLRELLKIKKSLLAK